MCRKVQMRRTKMWREGHRRSPRISALDATRKAQPSRPIVAQNRPSSVCLTSSATTSNLRVLHHHRKRRRLDDGGEGPTSRTRGAKKKRKLRPLPDVASPSSAYQQDSKLSDEQDDGQTSHGDLLINNDQSILHSEDSRKHEGRVTNPGEPTAMPCASQMPEKRRLELILDILQRRDTHEIFAEPVDPNKVEDYYEIIKEPMDFGTMRAKLHEGMYNSLEQFERDVFLISGNAMHFNSSSTIYFRQARAIDELAKKVFHVLKTDPENFEFEFSGTRRRFSRKPKGEARSLVHSSSSKLVTNSRFNSTTCSVSRKLMHSSASVISNIRTAMPAVPLSSASGIAIQSGTRDVEKPFGGRDGRGSGSLEAERRSAYKPWFSILNDNCSIVSTIYSNSKLLVHVNQQDNSYHESLMSFVKDLGPTAQMIAQRKLNGWSTGASNNVNLVCNWPKAQNSNYETSGFAQWIPAITNTAVTNENCQNLSCGDRIDMHDANKGERAYPGDRTGICGTAMELVSHGNDRSTFDAIRLEARSSNGMDALGVSRNDNFQQNQISIPMGMHPSISNVRDVNFAVARLNNKDRSTKLTRKRSKTGDNLQSLNSSSNDCQPNILECRSKDGYNFSLSPWPLETTASGISGFDQTLDSMNNLSLEHLGSYDRTVPASGAAHELSSSTEANWTSKSSQTLTTVPQFTFDLPFLKNRLDQMNSLGQDKFLQQRSGAQGPFLDRMSETYHDNHPHSSFDNQRNSLALQL